MEKSMNEKHYEIHYYETNYTGEILFSNLINFFNDVAVQHSEKCGMGLKFLAEKQIAWVLYKLNLKISRYPKFMDKVLVKTWTYSFNKFYGYREFEVQDSDGNIIATADSIWLLINTVKRRPVKISDELYKAFGSEMLSDKTLDIPDIPKLEEESNSLEFKVRYSDIDTNRHVNSAKYAIWLIEAVPLDIVLNYTMVNINIIYKKETTYGETIKTIVNFSKTEDRIICIHKIINSNGAELNAAQTEWVKN